jgi:hypothetical protein
MKRAATMPAVEIRAVEIRSYRLKPGTREMFDQLMSDIAVPMLRRWHTDVVRHGASAHDDVSYYLVRAYAGVEDRQRRQDEFYGSAEWREGPRQAILDLIEDRAATQWITRPTSVVIPMDDDTIDRLRNKEREDV